MSEPNGEFGRRIVRRDVPKLVGMDQQLLPLLHSVKLRFCLAVTPQDLNHLEPQRHLSQFKIHPGLLSGSLASK